MAYKIIDSSDLISELIDCIDECPIQPPLLFVDQEGINLGRQGSISIMQILIPPSPLVYLIDIYTLKEKSFHTQGEKGSSLKDILESKDIPKVFYDCRNDSDALYSHFQINLQCIIDLQLLEFTTRRVHGKFLKGLGKCISEDAGLSYTEILESKRIKDKGVNMFAPEKGGSYEVFNKRPLDNAILEYCALDVMVMPQLLRIYASKLRHGLSSQIHDITLRRIAQSQGPNYNGKGRHMAEGPFISWNRTSDIPPPFPMSVVCSVNIAAQCSLDHSLPLKKIESPISTKIDEQKQNSSTKAMTSSSSESEVSDPFSSIIKKMRDIDLKTSSENTSQTSISRREIFGSDDVDYGYDCDRYSPSSEQSSKDFTACSADDCGYCGHCSY